MSLSVILHNPFLYIFLLVGALGTWWLLRRIPPALPIFIFEKVGNPPSNSSLKNQWISVKKLTRLLRRLQHRNFTFITPAQLTSKLPVRPVLLVFMGGYRSFYQNVFPLLKQQHIPAVLCLAPDLIGTYNAWQNPAQEPWQDMITQNELAELIDSGLVSVGALPLGVKDISTCSTQEAVFLLRESVFRFNKQLNIQAQVMSTYPSQENNIFAQTDCLKDLPPLALITEQKGLNPLPLSSAAYKGIFPALHPFLTRLLIWKLR